LGHVASKRDRFKFLWEIPKQKDHLEYLGVEGRTVFVIALEEVTCDIVIWIHSLVT
jgi:hypothetical protein